MCSLEVVSQLPAQRTCSYAFPTITESHSGTISQNNLSLKVPLDVVFYTATEKEIKTINKLQRCGLHHMLWKADVFT